VADELPRYTNTRLSQRRSLSATIFWRFRICYPTALCLFVFLNS